MHDLKRIGNNDKQSLKNGGINMKHFKNHYGQSRIFKERKFNLQLFAEPTDPPADPQDPPTDPKDEKKYSDKDVDDIVNKKFARWQADKEKELKAQAEAAKLAQEEAAKLAKMNAEQKQQYEMEKLQKENAELKANQVRIELGKEASNLLAEKNIVATQDILDFVVGTDAETTKSNIDRFVKIIEAQVKQAEIARATGTTPRNITNNNNSLSEIDKRIAKYQ